VVFVAVIIPATMPSGPLWRAVAVGIVANAILLAVVLAVWTVIRRMRG
jgi:hypothetical protein